LSTGTGTWGHVNRLIQENSWDKVILITNEYGKENFNKNEKTEFIVINPNQGLKELREEIYIKLKEKVTGTEIGINFISGSGKEHMALISAVLKLGVGIRLVAITKDGMEEI
jgi:Na+-transporting NADH:ubiquinone oxidoreductase subunit NqrF